MKVYRGIAVNEGETINTENLGCSWSLCSVFADNHANEIKRAKGKDGVVVLEAEISEDMIDVSNTLYAMETRPDEYEVVLFTSDITCGVSYSEIDSIEEGSEVEGNTGANNFEDYNENYEGYLTMADFLELAEQF